MMYLIIINLVSFIIYGLDKFFAIKRWLRVPEMVLFLLAFIGGVYGCFLGMKVFRHKTSKWYFHIWNDILMIIWGFVIWRYL